VVPCLLVPNGYVWNILNPLERAVDTSMSRVQIVQSTVAFHFL